MRIRGAVAVAGLLALAGCGDDGDYTNKDRPPATINVTASIAAVTLIGAGGRGLFA